jgi:hypothetical protein
VLDEKGNVKQDQIKKGQTVKLVFTELRPIRPEEWALLNVRPSLSYWDES